MSTKQAFKESYRTEPTLKEEFGLLGNDDVVDFMNLTQDETGIRGILFLSTAMGSHGPRVKYFVKAGKDQQSFFISISSAPSLVASSLSNRVTHEMAPTVIEWVKLNRAALMKFWSEGMYWSRSEVNAFAEQLKKLP